MGVNIEKDNYPGLTEAAEACADRAEITEEQEDLIRLHDGYAHEHDGSVHIHDDHANEHGDHTHSHDGHTHEHSGHAHEHGGHTHSHDGHSHTHTHDPKEMKKIINRLARCIGHMEAVKRMVENGQDCSEVLIQLAAVRSEINGAGKALLKEHLDHCIVEAVAENDREAIARMNQAIDQFMK